MSRTGDASLTPIGGSPSAGDDEDIAFKLDQLGDLVAAIGSREFGPTFFSVFGRLIEAEECTVFSFPDPANPRALLVEGDPSQEASIARKLAQDYVSGGFLIDPNVRRGRNIRSSVNVYIVDFDDFNDNDYRKHYYETPNLSQELVMIGSFSGTVYYVSFYRKQGGKTFYNREVGIMRRIAGFTIKSLHRHQQLVNDEDSESLRFTPSSLENLPSELRQETLEHLKQVLLSGPYKLSQREAEICAGIIMGFSTEGIGLNCSISPNTVATHRKRAYAKLGICSQNELFLRYFSTVRNFQDHLRSYKAEQQEESSQ